MRITQRIWVFALMVLLVMTLANAGSYNPETYWGYVYVEGALAPSGTVLTAESTNTGEQFASQTLPFNLSYPGSYSIMINFDDTYTAGDEGADINETLTWKINGVAASTPAVGIDKAESGNTNNNFAIYGIINPAITATLQKSSNTTTLGQSIDLTVKLNNTGSGSGNSTLASIDDSTITTDLPKTLYVQRNSTNHTIVNITPSTCGQYTPTLTIDNYNLAGTLVDTLNEQFNFSVTGADLVLGNIGLSNSNPTQGDTISITSTVTNNGTLNITGFTVRFYYDTTLIDTITSNETLGLNESIGVSANWDAVLGTSTINLTLSTTGTECYTTNNYRSAAITVQQETQQTTGGGSGGGGVTTTRPGHSSHTECNDTIDNDGDGLIDYPSDPGCKTLNDDNETDTTRPRASTDLEKQEENQTVGAGIIPPQEEPRKSSGGFVPLITGFVTAAKKEKSSLLWLLLILMLCATITYKLLSKMQKEEPPQQKQQEITVEIFPKFRVNYAKKQDKLKQDSQEPALIQKSIKISSKKDVIDKLKEVYNKNG